jgi:hypothetical protein
LIVVFATSAPPFQPHNQQNVCHQGGFLADQTDLSHYGPSPGCEADVHDVPTVVLEFSPELLGLYRIWHCHDEAVSIFQVGLDVFCELHPEASTELRGMMQNSHFHHTSENGLTVLPDNPKTR